MAIFTFSNATLWMAQYDLSSDLKSLAVNINAVGLDDTVLGNDTRQVKAGLFEINCNAGGLFQVDASSPQVDDALTSKLTVDNVPITTTPNGASDGAVSYFFESLISEYSPFSNSVGDLMAFAFAAQGGGKWSRGTIMIPKAAYTATGAGTIAQLGAVSAGQRMHASLHCFSASAGDTCDVIVESDDAVGFTTPTTQITFTQISGGNATSEFLYTDGSAITDDYWRVSYTIAGDGGESFTFAVVLGIR